MSRYRFWIIGALTALAVLTLAAPRIRAAYRVHRGREACRQARYDQAAECFRGALELNPGSLEARRLLATAYMNQYVPGGESPENLRLAQAAQDEFRAVLERTPKDETSLLSLGSLYLQQQRFEEAARTYGEVIEVNPRNKEAYYALGLIAWSRFSPAYWSARAALGLMPEDLGPVRDQQVLKQLRREWLPIVDEGLKNLRKAVEIDQEYDDAMRSISLLTRAHAELVDDAAQYNEEIRAADTWASRALEIGKLKAERRQGATQRP